VFFCLVQLSVVGDITIMPRWLKSWCAVVLVCALTCGHTVGLQLLAWAGMLVARTSSSGWSHAADTTFDGKHPCQLCLMVKAMDAASGDVTGKPGHEKPDPKPVEKPLKKVDTVVPAVVDPLLAQPASQMPDARTISIMKPQSRPAPELPPPRAG
jgi:hypothetical protein